MLAAEIQELADRVKKDLVHMRSAREANSSKILALKQLATSLVATTEDPASCKSAPIDAARADAHLAITGLAMTLEQSPHSPFDILWGKAIDAAEKWRRSLD
jgi:hypothetical protein